MHELRATTICNVLGSYGTARKNAALDYSDDHLVEIIGNLPELDGASTYYVCIGLKDGFIADGTWFYPMDARFTRWVFASVQPRVVHSTTDIVLAYHCTGEESPWVKNDIGTFETTILEVC